MGSQSSGRLIFAQQLRGLAALAVVASHLIGVYWASPQVLASATATPTFSGTPPLIFSFVSQPWFNPGPFGVAVFFLISGLVIPFSLARHSSTSFLMARAARIYPVAICAMLLETAVIGLNAAHWRLPMPFGRFALVTNLLLINDLVGRPSIDLVNWTLCIELKFYVLMAIAAPAIRAGRLWPLAATAAIAVALGLMHSAGLFQWKYFVPFRILTFDFSYLCFMGVGVLFNYQLRGLIGILQALIAGALLMAAFIISGRLGPNSDVAKIVEIQYVWGLALFGLLYACRRWAKPFAPLDGLAAISYPLYLVHPVLGFTAMRWLMLGAGAGYYPSLAVAVAVAIGVAVALHFAIERRSIKWGARFAIKPSDVRPLQAA